MGLKMGERKTVERDFEARGAERSRRAALYNNPEKAGQLLTDGDAFRAIFICDGPNKGTQSSKNYLV